MPPGRFPRQARPAGRRPRGRSRIRWRGLYLLTGLGMLPDPPVRARWCGRGKGSLGNPAGTATSVTRPRISGWRRMDGWMDGPCQWDSNGQPSGVLGHWIQTSFLIQLVTKGQIMLRATSRVARRPEFLSVPTFSGSSTVSRRLRGNQPEATKCKQSRGVAFYTVPWQRAHLVFPTSFQHFMTASATFNFWSATPPAKVPLPHIFVPFDVISAVRRIAWHSSHRKRKIGLKVSALQKTFNPHGCMEAQFLRNDKIGNNIFNILPFISQSDSQVSYCLNKRIGRNAEPFAASGSNHEEKLHRKVI